MSSSTPPPRSSQSPSHTSQSPSTTNAPSPLPHFSPISLKLDRNNYTFWRTQVLPIIRGYGFDEHISNTLPPSPLLASSSGTTSPNPVYANWIRKDQLLLGWLVSSIGETMLGHVVRCSTAKELWIVLERLFLSHSRSRIMQLRMLLQTTKKGNINVEEYFLKMRSYADQLSAVGQQVSDEDLVMYLLAGFGSEYEALVVNVMNRPDALNAQDLQLLFQSYEARLQQQVEMFSPCINTPSANVAYRGYGRGGRGNLAGAGRGSTSKVIMCQLCGRPGHVALKCYKRFDVHFTSQEPNVVTNPQAFSADVTSEENPSDDGVWYMDSGASAHITKELQNLDLSSEYSGNEKLMVGDGNTLQISSIGQSHSQASVEGSLVPGTLPT